MDGPLLCRSMQIVDLFPQGDGLTTRTRAQALLAHFHIPRLSLGLSITMTRHESKTVAPPHNKQERRNGGRHHLMGAGLLARDGVDSS